jgi:hypothetical protein
MISRSVYVAVCGVKAAKVGISNYPSQRLKELKQYKVSGGR